MNRRVKRTLCTGLAALMLAGCMTGTTVYAETAKEKVDRLEAALKQEKASLEKLQKDKKNAEATKTKLQNQSALLKEQMAALLGEIRKRFDYCLLDAPAGLGSGFQLATCAADRCVVVTCTDASSLRDAQHTVMELSRFPTGSLHLIVNRVRKKLLRSMHATIDDAIDKAGLPLLGVVPEDDALPLCLNRGVPLLLAGSGMAASAYRNIAKRIQGVRVPLLRIK